MGPFNQVLVGVGGRPGRDALVLAKRLVGPEAHVTMADDGLARDLRKIATEREVDLLVVGSPRRPGLLHRLRGDDVRAALNGGHYVLAIAPQRYAPVRRRAQIVGVGYDGTDESQAAVVTAARLAAEQAALLRLRLVIPEDGLPGARKMRQAGQRLMEEVNNRLSSLSELGDQGRLAIESQAVYGDPAEELERLSRQVDLLVVGSRGYGPIERLVPRGVLGHLAEHTACPLIVVPSAGSAS